jgi:hypothetical protein
VSTAQVRDSERFDLFICHASEDKEVVARPLAQELLGRGLKVWLDELELTIGDSLNGRIEAALARSSFGVVVISPAFFAKKWPQRELAGLAAREIDVGSKVILPVWHDVDHHYIAQRSPILADRLGALTSDGLSNVADKISLALQRAGTVHPFAPSLASGDVTVAASHVRESDLRAQARRLGGAGVALALSAAIGFTATRGGNGSGTSVMLPNSAANEAFEVSLPTGWRRSSTLPSLPGLELTAPLPLRSSASGRELIVGGEQTTSTTLLPSDLLSILAAKPRPEAVRLGSTHFYRYRSLEPKDAVSAETVYAGSTTSGVLLGVCVLPRRSPAQAEAVCEQIMGSLKLLSATSMSLGPQPSYAAVLRSVLSQLNAARTTWGARLAHAKTTSAQATAAVQLADAHEHAATALRAVEAGPAERAVGASIVSALDHIALGYAAMVAGARAQDSEAFERGRTAAIDEARRLASAVSRLSGFGYRVSD